MPGKGRGSKSTPPGWSKGKKTGWGDGEAPPGLGRKAQRGGPDEEVPEVPEVRPQHEQEPPAPTS